MEREFIRGRNISDAVRELLDLILIRRDKKVIYFDGWSGLGVTPVLRSVAQNLSSVESPPELYHHRLIYIDCSEWKGRRVLQRKIAEELKFDQASMDMFDKQDEEDDFNGVEQASRDLILDVSIMIDKSLRERSFIIIFLNGSDEELDLVNYGVPTFSRFVSNIMIWSFQKRSLTMQNSWNHYSSLQAQLRYTHLFAEGLWEIDQMTVSELSSLLRKEAASMIARHPCIQDLDLTMVTDCCFYEMFLYYSFHSATASAWEAHAPNYWICDGMIKGDRAREISNALHPEIRWECDVYHPRIVCKKIMDQRGAPFLVLNFDGNIYRKNPYRWVTLTSKNLKVQGEDLENVMKEASSLFVAFERTDNTPTRLPNELFKHCSNLGVLVLFCCAFNFAAPPFLRCRGLKFLGVDHCTNDLTREEEECCMDWAFLYSLWVLDLRYTDWDEILAEEKIDLMANLWELNVEGLKCWQYISQLQTRLPYLQRLRIIRPTEEAEISVDSNNSFVEKTKLEVLDLSGNSDMKKLPPSLSNASRLQVLVLDGCDGLENVDAPNELPSSLTSFSLDSYGPASHSRLPPDSSRSESPSKKNVKTSKISLRGCTQLSNLFLRGLSNLMELDLSGSALKLRAIKWGKHMLILELLCIDTRPGIWTHPSPLQHGPSSWLQVHAVLADVRLVRSLWFPIHIMEFHFHIHVPSSSVATVNCRTIQQPEATSNEMTEPTEQQCHCLASKYGDVLTQMGDHAPTLMEAFPEPPASLLDKHVEITSGSHILETELHRRSGRDVCGLADLMTEYAKSLHVHDASISVSMPAGRWYNLRWCRVERCPSLGPTLFPSNAVGFDKIEIVWASELTMARCLWMTGCDFENLQHLYLRSCPRLQYALPLRDNYPCYMLKTIHIVHCGDLRHIFTMDEDCSEGVLLKSLNAIHLHDLPKLIGICDKVVFAPNLEAVRIRGCFGLRRLPAVDEYLGQPARGVRLPMPTVEMEKDVWDALKWDGMDARHHPSYYEPPLHSRYYRRSRLLRGTVLR